LFFCHGSGALEKGASVKAKCYLAASSFEGPLVLNTKLYATGTDGEKVKVVGTLPLPCAVWVTGAKLTDDAFRGILSDPAQGCSFLASNQVALQRMSVKEALQAICVFAGVTLVEAINFTATFYGKTVHGAHVCLLVKASRESNELSFDCKCPSQKLADAVWPCGNNTCVVFLGRSLPTDLHCLPVWFVDRLLEL
jgi:hypothetical protein